MSEKSILARHDVTPRQAGVLLVSILVVALCGIVYELIIASISSYLLGDSVYQFSVTIGLFMFAMGVGSYFSKYFEENLIHSFVVIESILALVGGLCGLALFAMFPFAPALYSFVQFAFILAIGGLVGLEIPLLTRVLAEKSSARESLAHVLSLDYLGALIGSVAFPLLLLPSLGLLRASFAIGLINACVALVNVYYLRDHIPNWNRLFTVALSSFLLLVGLTIAGSWITSFAQHHLYLDDIVYREQTPYQNLVVTQDNRRGDLRLFIDGHIQFSEMDEHRYHEMLVHPVLSAPGSKKNVLVLGGGDGLALREILKHDGVERIDLVDLDPAMTRMGEEFAPLVRLNQGSMQDSRLTVYNQDAFTFIQQTALKYDRVIMDFPDPHNEALSKLYSVEFYAMLRRRLTPDAVVITQSSSPFFARTTFWTITRTLEEVFPRVEPLHLAVPAFGLWGFNIARMPDAAMDETRIEAPTRFLDDATLAAAAVFPKDIGRPSELSPNSIFEPRLYAIYLNDLAGGGDFKMPTFEPAG